MSSQRPPKFFTSTVGSKVVVGLTGLLLCGFLVAHLGGNLLLLVGARQFNEYSEKLTSNELIYFAEAGLLAIFLTHVFFAARATLNNQTARPIAYTYKSRAGDPSRKSLASTTMIYTGLLLIFFIIIHLKGMKFSVKGKVPGGEMEDLCAQVVLVFSSPVKVAFYGVMMLLLGFHLWHGFSSAFQSLGISHPKYAKGIVLLGRLFALAIAGGFLFLPIWVHFHGVPR